VGSGVYDNPEVLVTMLPHETAISSESLPVSG
jgi:hypothetical protein